MFESSHNNSFMKRAAVVFCLLIPFFGIGQNVLIEPTGISPNSTSSFVQKSYDDILNIINPSKGEVYFDSTFNEVRVFDGTEWVRLLNANSERVSADFFTPETSGTSSFIINKLAINSDGEYLAIGRVKGKAYFNSASISSPDSLTSSIFLICLNRDFELKWSQQGAGSVYLYNLGIDSNDNIYVTGEYSDYCNFGGVPLNKLNSFVDTFIAKIDSEGNVAYVNTISSAAESYRFHDIEIGQSTMFMAGIVFLGGVQTPGLLASYNLTDGSVAWSKTLTASSSGYIQPKFVSLSDGYLYFGGEFNEAITIDSKSLSSPSGGGGVFLLKASMSNGDALALVDVGATGLENYLRCMDVVNGEIYFVHNSLLLEGLSTVVYYDNLSCFTSNNAHSLTENWKDSLKVSSAFTISQIDAKRGILGGELSVFSDGIKYNSKEELMASHQTDIFLLKYRMGPASSVGDRFLWGEKLYGQNIQRITSLLSTNKGTIISGNFNGTFKIGNHLYGESEYTQGFICNLRR